jgi:hypothetical protein
VGTDACLTAEGLWTPATGNLVCMYARQPRNDSEIAISRIGKNLPSSLADPSARRTWRAGPDIYVAGRIEQAHICFMGRIACNCGAIYEAVPLRRPRDPNSFKCLECGKESILEDYRIGELRIVARPQSDRE